MATWQNSIHEIIVEDACKRDRLLPDFGQPPGLATDAKLVGRGDTTVVDAYLSPILRAMSTGSRASSAPRLRAPTGPTLQFMMSSGGLTAADMFQGKDAILSGPAGGVVGMVETGARRLRQGHRLRHGRHLHRRRPL
jgi:5-oxoprolinase (ATP-hydrolysing)